MRYIGIDPGLTGALAYVGPHGACVFDLPTREASKGAKVKNEIDPKALAATLRYIAHGAEPCIALLERTASRPGQGVASMFSMGVSRGIILGVFGATSGVELREVEPAKWKAAFQLLGAPKEESLRVARELYPQLADKLSRAKDHNRAEALLLAHYLRGIA